jgi:hypothetical protein
VGDRQQKSGEYKMSMNALKQILIGEIVRNARRTEQTELLTIPRDYSKIKRELPEQKEISDLPIFNIEYQNTEQISLFA